MRVQSITPQFIEHLPECLTEGVLYVSQRYKLAAHKCCCGCGQDVITPLTPADWRIRMDGDLVTLHPSIGNWKLDCHSHYWIRRNRIEWAGSMTKRQVALVQRRDEQDKARFIELVNSSKEAMPAEVSTRPRPVTDKVESLFQRVWSALRNWLGV